MKHAAIATALVLAMAGPALAEDERAEPPLRYTLELDGKSYPLEAHREIELKGTFVDPKVKLVPASTRLFTYGGVQFRYPAYFAWEAEIQGPHYKSWILSGNDFKIMYFVLAAGLAPDAYASSMVRKFGKSNCKVEPVQHELGGTPYKGKRLTARVAGSELIQDALRIPSKRGTKLLVLQDSVAADKQSNAESAFALKLLRASFKPR